MTNSLSLFLSKEKVKTKFIEKTNFSETYCSLLFSIKNNSIFFLREMFSLVRTNKVFSKI